MANTLDTAAAGVFRPSRRTRTDRTLPPDLDGALRRLMLEVQMLMTEDERADIAARIKELRENSPYTQPEIAAKVGIGLRGYQKWEKVGVNYSNAEKLAEIYGVSANFIMKGPDRDETPDPFANGSGGLRDEVSALDERITQIEAKVTEMIEIQRETLALVREERRARLAAEQGRRRDEGHEGQSGSNPKS